MGVGERGGRDRERGREKENGNINGGILVQRFGYSARLFVHSQKVITAKAGSCVPKSAYYRVWTVTFVLHCFRHNRNLQINYFLLYCGKNTSQVVNKSLSIQCSIVNYRYSAVQQISRTCSSCVTETSCPLSSISLFLPPPAPGSHYPNNFKVPEMVSGVCLVQ